MFPSSSCILGKRAVHLQSQQEKLDKQEGARKREGERELWDVELDDSFKSVSFSLPCFLPSALPLPGVEKKAAG